ncbi:hypothetical protein K503DRAFT_550358 [Rhizopogon vinicolor AM-OR11-026]|uniref:Uncharacterized protein n=1 Tax=Rhizopogon vinicolor AM-OR11-026 TaxID=1314800 RepID=A0A1B7N843_9AGAM|nr:hypothetical protein K503DRAFT_550358 [Rhizopogon vinicolor AM-OR11-026]
MQHRKSSRQMPALSLVWNEWYKGGLIEVNAYASGDRLVPPRSEADIFENVKEIQLPICGKVNDLWEHTAACIHAPE